MPECTAAAVTEALAFEGFTLSVPTGPGPHDRSDGVFARDLPLSQPRVGVYCHPEMTPVQMSQLVLALGPAGYLVERVADFPGDYLVAWTEGDF